MKNRKNLFYIGMFAICVLGFAACGDDETYDVYGDPYNRVYILDNSKEYKIVQTPVSTVSNVDFTWEARCSKKASGDIRVTVAVDNSLIDAYNEEHDTEFEALPVEAVVLENAEMTIPAGEMVVADAVHLKLTDDANVLSTLKSAKGYIIPLRLVSAEGGNSQLSTNMLAPSFLTITVTEDNMNHEAIQYTGTGALVADQTGWTATTNGTVQSWYDPIESIFDGNGETYCYISNRSGDLWLDVDMGKPYSFDGIRMMSSSYYGDSGSFSAGMTVSTSDNGTDWKAQGEIESDAEDCVFYAPLTARYIRITVPNAGGWYGASLECGVFNVYAK
ncbi:BT_3987 domain-containing protein [Bacteroides congonensis]|uniref:BT_3987 domain-containing protein n=1 Tax=Bacteroides congonensis TaxID=1871006 RepID=UPI000336DEB1|nr:DUF1735 domain-containing protein [Bacteroides congonensis]CDA82641.1 f5/8 type C domain protein [Bacteroides sp. CAG:754]